MAADILIHRARYVPVGKDQEQHLEIARNYVNRFNHRYSEVFPEPVAYNFNNQLVKVPSLDGSGKMSKSVNELATLYLADEDDAIRKKVMKAKTDSGPTEHNSTKPDYIENLFLLMKLVSAPETLRDFEEKYNNCSIRYGDMKKQLAEDMVKFISPIRNKINTILEDESYLQKIMKQGAEKAIASAEATMKMVRDAMGLNYLLWVNADASDVLLMQLLPAYFILLILYLLCSKIVEINGQNKKTKTHCSCRKHWRR